jgi:AcrR family transcriptional regulator
MGNRKNAATSDTEKRLLDCALTLFAERGYAATTIREIIESAGVTRPVLYYYCDSKQGIFLKIVRTTLGETYLGLAQVLFQHSGCADRLRAIARGSFAFCAQDPRVPMLMFQIYAGPVEDNVQDLVSGLTAYRFGVIAQVMRDGLANGEITGGDAESLALVFCCLIDQHINVLVRLPKPETRLTPDLADALVDVFLNGLGVGDRNRVLLPPFAASPEHTGE